MKKTWMLLPLILCSSLSWALAPKQPISDIPTLNQEEQHTKASQRIANRFLRSHYHRFALDDAFSKRVNERFIELLDYNKMFLLQSDVATLKQNDTLFDDMLKSGQLDRVYAAFNLIAKRRYERFSFALSLLDTPMNFEVPGEVYYYDREESQFVNSVQELDELWRQRVKNEALNLTLTGKKWDEVVKILARRYNGSIKRLSQTNSEDVFQLAMNAFARTIEPHTSYLSPRNAERFQQEMNLSLEGIGAVLMVEDEYTTIRSVVSGGPADKSGKLKPKDKIIGVKQEDGEMEHVIGWRLDDVVDLIKGPKGSTVTLEILPAKGGAESFQLSIVRDKIKLEDKQAKGEVIELPEHPNKSIGVIEIPGFYMNLSVDVAKILVDFNKQNVDGVIVDLRGNGGGALSEATALTGLFIEQGPVVQIRDPYGRIRQERDSTGTALYDGPVTVMLDRYSASASEIFAAALQDYGRALIVGEPSFGKGTVQQHAPLQKMFDMSDDMGHVQYTIAKFYRINGGSTQIKGVTPDIVFPSPFAAGEHGEADEKNPLPWDQIAKSTYRKINTVSPLLISSLLPNHEKRMSSSVEVGYIKDDIARYKRERDKVSITLVKSEREQRRKEDEAKALTRLNERLARAGLDAVKDLDDAPEEFEPEDAYLNEAAILTLEMRNSSLYAQK